MGSVSAADDSIDANLTDIDNSLGISELKEVNDIDEVTSDGSVDVENEEVLGNSNDDVLGADTTLEIKDPKESYTKDDSITIQIGSFSMASSSDSVNVYLNDENVATTTYGEIQSSNGYTLALSNAIIGENTIYCQGQWMLGSYTSDTVTFTVAESGSGGGEDEPSVEDIELKISEGNSGYYYAFTDDFALISVAANARYPTTVNFEVISNSTLSNPKIRYGTDKNDLNQEKSITGSYSLIFSSGTYASADVNNAIDKTYYVQIVDGNSKSNIVIINVKQGGATISQLGLEPYYGAEGSTISTKLVDIEYSGYSYTFVGNATFYSSSSYNANTRLGTVSTEGGTLLVPGVNNAGGCCVWTTLYYVFSGIRNDGAGAFKTGQTDFIAAYTNSIELTSNSNKDAIEITSDSIPLEISSAYYMNDGTDSFYEIYVDNATIGTFTVKSTTEVNDYTLDVSNLEAGEHDVYVKYSGYWDSENEDYYAEGESNHLKINVPEPEKTLKIDIEAVEYPNTVTAIVNASEVGTYTITVNGRTFPVEITEEDNGIKTVSLGKFDAAEEYQATIVSDDDAALTNATTFAVNKGTLTIELSRDGEDKIVKPGETVSFTIIFSDEITENLELWINDYSLGDEDGSSSTSITFDESDVGSNDVFIKFFGSDNYNACVSNNVTITVVKPISTTISLELSSNEVIPGQNITLIPKVFDENNNLVTVGEVRIYDNMYCNNDPIATIKSGETVNFTDLTNYAGTTHFLYAKYMGSENGDEIYAQSPVSAGVSYTVIADNKLELTANGESEITVYVGQSVDILATVNGNGVITLFVDGVENTTLTKGTATSFALDKIGDYEFTASYARGSDYYVSVESNKVTVHVIDKNNIELDVYVDEDQEEDNYYESQWGDSFEIETRVSEDIEGEIIYMEGETELGRAAIGEVFDLDSEDLGLGQHVITAVFEGNESYNGATFVFTINVNKHIIWYTLEIDDVSYPNHAVGRFYGTDTDGTFTITINGTEYPVEFEWYDEGGTVSFDINQLPIGTYTVSDIRYEDMEHYEFGESEIEGKNKLPTFTVKGEEVILNDSVLNVANGTAPVFSIDLPGATGNLTVEVNGKNYTAELKDGKATVEITDLPAGNYTATVTYTGDASHQSSSVPASFKVDEKSVPDANKTLDVNIPAGSSAPVFEINLPNATGNLTVTIGNDTYTKELVNGSASITVDNLTPGSYNATVSYSGDKNYKPISKDVTFTVPAPVLKGKNISVVYSSKANYKVLLTLNGKAVAGEKVVIKFNGKTYNAVTDKNGYATVKLNTKVKAKKYTVTAEYKGVKTSNTVTVKHLIKAKNVKVKKSKRVSKIKVKTKKVNGKFLKGKKLKLKLKGKTLKAKINKKGVATFKVKKNILKKLKVGKKYKYTVSYGKDKVTKKVKVKR